MRTALPVSTGISSGPVVPPVISSAATLSGEVAGADPSSDADLVAFDGLDPPGPQDNPATLRTALDGVEAIKRGLRTLGIDMEKHKAMFETVKRVSQD